MSGTGRFQPGDRVRYESQYNEHGERVDETLYGTAVRTDSSGVEVQFDGYDGTDGFEDDTELARNLSDEARFLQRLAEPELPPGASDAERAAADNGKPLLSITRCIYSLRSFRSKGPTPCRSVTSKTSWDPTMSKLP